MNAVSTFAATTRRKPLSTLSKYTIAALIGFALALTYAQAMLIRQIDPPLAVFTALMLAAAGLVATGWRWTPFLGALLSALVVVGNIGPVIHDLSHPEVFSTFVFMVITVALAVVGFTSGIGAGIQGYRSGERRAPQGMGLAATAFVGLCVGTLLTGSLARGASTISPELLASLPAMTTPGMAFGQTTLTVKAGEMVAMRLDNTHGAPHAFDIDELNVHVPVGPGQQNLILFKPTQPGSYTFYCAVPGHREAGMVGTLVVE